MNVERPDLSQLAPDVRTYIEALEAELDQLRRATPGASPEAVAEPALELSELPTTLNVITMTAGGVAKRTPRHLYSRQHRGGMGVFDLDAPRDDPPALLIIADASQVLVLFTDQGRAFRLPVGALPESAVHSRGQRLTQELPLQRDERLIAVLPAQDSGYIALVSQRGYVRRLRYHYVGENMEPGTALFDVGSHGPLAAVCWTPTVARTPGDGELFIATRNGRAIRFGERQVPLRGCLGIRPAANDAVVTVSAVRSDDGVFLLGASGKGTVRLMTGFRPNKLPGGSGKRAMGGDRLVSSVVVDETDDLFIISRLGKIIRFSAAEVPAKESVVIGVNCMGLRGDETVAVARS